tara:strand:+ start:139 stop:351 length:213 start_codon:yes stop_codon:yes gene_type:complete
MFLNLEEIIIIRDQLWINMHELPMNNEENNRIWAKWLILAIKMDQLSIYEKRSIIDKYAGIMDQDAFLSI